MKLKLSDIDIIFFLRALTFFYELECDKLSDREKIRYIKLIKKIEKQVKKFYKHKKD